MFSNFKKYRKTTAKITTKGNRAGKEENCNIRLTHAPPLSVKFQGLALGFYMAAVWGDGSEGAFAIECIG